MKQTYKFNLFEKSYVLILLTVFNLNIFNPPSNVNFNNATNSTDKLYKSNFV